MHGVLGFRSGAAEVSVLLGYGFESLDFRSSAFRDNVVVSTSRIGSPSLFNFRPLKCRNTGHPTPIGVVPYPTGKNTSNLKAFFFVGRNVNYRAE
jgi:hypothetical protein